MRVTLLEDVASIGPKGLSVEVPDGYAVNFLFPQFLAVKSEEPKLDEQKSREPSAEELADQQLAAEVDGLDLVIPLKIVKGKVKKGITATEVRAALKAQEVIVPKSVIKMKTLNEPGTYEVNLEFPSGFEAKVTVTLESES
jgi:ribosomal protein L9